MRPTLLILALAAICSAVPATAAPPKGKAAPAKTPPPLNLTGKWEAMQAGFYGQMRQVGSVILHLTRDTDKKSRIDNNTYGVLLPKTPPENLPVVLKKIENELKNVKIEHKGEVVRYAPMVLFGYSSFPGDGDNDAGSCPR